MAFFEGLKGIIPAKIAEQSYDYDLKLSHSKSDSQVKYKVEKSKKILTLYLNKLSYNDKKTLKKHLLKNFDDSKLRFVEEESVVLIEKLVAYNKKDDGKTLKFFENILSKPDLYALRDSLFLRDETAKSIQQARILFKVKKRS